jgi:two-component system sensor histidine kinase SenX3
MAELIIALAAGASGVVIGWWLGSHHDREDKGDTGSGPHQEAAAPPVAVPEPPVEWAQIRQALDDLRLGVVVLDAEGEEIYRNRAAGRYATRRHGNAIVDAALERVVQGAMIGLSLEEAVELYGPPAKSLLVQASPTHEGDSVAGVVAMIEDVTEAHHLDRVRRDFVANVSHELRTPVGAMTVLIDALSDSDDPEVVQRLTDRLQQEAGRLVQTIDDLLVLSRLESGPIDVRETTDLASIALMAVERVTEAATARSIKVAVDRTFDGPILIECDPGQLVSAVANLLENAIKYSDGGATVTLRLGIHDRTVDAGSGPPNGAHEPLAVLSVIDSGIGIPERDLARIFERFYRVDTARSRETGGTGLGLSIVRHAVINHGGTVSVDSIEGRGSTFTISLPVSSARLQTDRFDADNRLPAGNGTTTSGDDGTML